jgi:hypothetical protein
MIGVMVVAVGTAVLVLIATPLLSWWIGGRKPWRQPNRSAGIYGPSDHYPPLALIRRHGLQPAEVTMVERAVKAGRELHDERLRAAVVELVEQRAGAAGGRRQPSLWLLIPFSIWGAVVVGRAVSLVAQGDWMNPNWFFLAYWLFVGVFGWRWQTAPERAIRLNSGPPSSARA